MLATSDPSRRCTRNCSRSWWHPLDHCRAASWWADREVDLAMTRMFGGFSTTFYRAYNEVLPHRSGWEERVEIYNLYHLLNHANLFGGGYVSQSQDCLKRLARTIT